MAVLFLQKSTNHSKTPRSATWFRSAKHSDDACTSRQDLKEQDKASRTQPWSARGLTDPKKFFATRERDIYWTQLELSEKAKKKRPKFVKTTFYTELFTRRRRKPDKHSIRKIVKTTIYTELFIRRRRKPDKHSTDQESMSRQRSIPSCLHGADENQTSSRQIKKVCQDNDLHTPSNLHNTDESQNKQLLGENSDHLDNSLKK